MDNYDTTAETWKPIVGFEGSYEISDQGRVRSWKRGKPRIMAERVNGAGRVQLWLSQDGQVFSPLLHVALMEAFVGPKPAGLVVRHLDGNCRNNVLSNLRYGTPSENQLDSVRHGTHTWARKTHCPRGHAYDTANTRVYNGSRNCRKCAVIATQNWRRRRAGVIQKAAS